ncbi:hypothetical protein BHE74_00026749 [Ensete ventricosum]|nr:hypothetical protein BHE74_00026749 [Ensete ventricosum]RZS05214.1 hypothetical protein BHM03_00035690 [Ensete ventricosum]
MKLSFSPLVSVFGFVFVFLCLRLQASSARVLPPPEPCPSAMAAMRVCLPHLAKSHYLFWHAYPPPTLQCCAAFSAAIEGPGAACLCLLARQKAFLGTPIETSRLFSLPFACGKPVDAFATEICQDSAPPAPPASAAPPAAAPPAYRINLRFTLTVSLPASVVVVLVLAILIYAIYLAQGRYVSSSITPGCEKVCSHLRMEGMEAGVDRLLLRLVALREGHPLQD